MRKKIFSLIFICLMLVSTSFNVLAADNEVKPRTNGLYIWKVDSKTNQGNAYGSWISGVQGKGQSTLTLSKSVSFSNTISGSYTSTGALTSALGFSVTGTYSTTASYSVNVPAGKTYTIQYRPIYTQYKVVQRQYYRIDGYDSPTNTTKTAYVKRAVAIGYRYI